MPGLGVSTLTSPLLAISVAMTVAMRALASWSIESPVTEGG